MSIEPAEARRKLEVVAVFVLVNRNGDFYQISRASADIIPLYLKESDAKTQLTKLLSSREKADARIQAYSLNIFYDKADKLRSTYKSSNKDLHTPIIVSSADHAKAVEILKKEGLQEAVIEKQLTVPVFFTEPMIAARSSGGQREVFFMTYEQLLQGMASLPSEIRGRAKKRVANLEVVMKLIEDANEDKYAFMETPEYSRLRKESLQNR